MPEEEIVMLSIVSPLDQVILQSGQISEAESTTDSFGQRVVELRAVTIGADGSVSGVRIRESDVRLIPQVLLSVAV